MKLIETQAFGLYHQTNRGSTTWYDFAREIFRLSGMEVMTLSATTEMFNSALDSYQRSK